MIDDKKEKKNSGRGFGAITRILLIIAGSVGIVFLSQIYLAYAWSGSITLSSYGPSPSWDSSDHSVVKGSTVTFKAVFSPKTDSSMERIVIYNPSGTPIKICVDSTITECQSSAISMSAAGAFTYTAKIERKCGARLASWCSQGSDTITITVTEPPPPPTTKDGSCGTAAKIYEESDTALSGTICKTGDPSNPNPPFPAPGQSTPWDCEGTGSPLGKSVTCTAYRKQAGACGGAATNSPYTYSASAFNGAFCSAGTANPSSPNFPAAGGSTSWSCQGTNGGANVSCSASHTGDTTPPSCGTWNPTASPWHASGGQSFTLSGSFDETNGSGIKTASGSCTTGVSYGNTCTVDIFDNANNKTTCTSPGNNLDTAKPSTPGTPSLYSGSSPNKSGSFTLSWSRSSDTSDGANPGSGGVTYIVFRAGSNIGSSANNFWFESNLGQGSYTYYIQAKDAVGNVSTASAEFAVVVDKTPPDCGSWSPSPAAWKTSGAQSFALSNSADTGGAGINTAGGSCNTGANNGDTCSVEINDKAGNPKSCTSPVNRIDTAPPGITSVTSSSLICESIIFTVNGATDSDSGLHASPYSFDGGTNWQAGNSKDFTGISKTLTANTIWVRDALGTPYKYASDISGSASSCDATGPTLNYAPNGSGGWKSSATTITLTVSDPSNVSAAKYNWDSAASASTGIDFVNNATIDSPAGTHTLYLWAKDTPGNPSTKGSSTPYQNDNAAPSTPVISCGSYVSDTWRNDTAPTCTWTNPGGPSPTTYYYCATSGCVPNTADSDRSVATSFGNGTNYFRVKNCDTGGCSESEFIVKRDQTKPSAPTISASTGSPTYNTSISVTWTASDDESGIRAQNGYWHRVYYVSDPPCFDGLTDSATFNITTTGTASGCNGRGDRTYSFYAFAENGAGLESDQSAQKSITVDTIAPTISSFSVTPASIGPTESFSISKTAADNTNGTGVKTIQIYRAAFSSTPDQSGNKCDDTNKNACAWEDRGNITSDNPNPGTYYYGIHVTDNAENCITESTGADGKGGHCGGANDGLVRTNFGLIKVIKISNNAPGTPTLISPPDGTWTNSRNFCVKVTDSDTNNDLTATFTINGVQKTGSTVKTGNNSCYDYTTMADTTATGVSWSVSVSDGTVATSGGPWTAKIDTVAPSGANISWKIVPNRATYSADTLILTNVSAKSVGTTASNYPTIEVNYSDNTGGSGIQTAVVGTPSEPRPTFKSTRDRCSILFPTFTLNSIQYNACSITNNKLTFTVPWSAGVDNNKANAIVIPLDFIKDKAGNSASGSITVEINNSAPTIR